MSTGGDQSFFEKLNNWIKNSITVKLFSIGIIILLLLIPTFMLEDLIRDRQYTSQNAIEEVGSKWGGSQTITGPIITIPYIEYVKNEKDELIAITQYAHFLPNQLNISGNTTTEKRYRGIYEIVVYNGKLNIKGEFPFPKPTELAIDPRNILWNETFIQIGITDMKGIKDNIELSLGDKKYSFNPGINSNDIAESGVSTKIILSDTLSQLTFNLDLNLNGSSQLYFIPLGKETNVDLASTWNSPSFDGSFLPATREVNKDGFKADWKILHLNRNFPQQWKENKYNVLNSSFGVDFIVTVDHYQKSSRAAKYAILIITLSFMGFFFVEIINKKRIHPFQYIIVGLAVCIFYALLLALSEHIGFNSAYILSGILIIGAISYYSKSMFDSKLPIILISSVLTILYGFIYIIIQLEDYALLMGSFGLFIVLITIMHISRKIKWYNN